MYLLGRVKKSTIYTGFLVIFYMVPKALTISVIKKMASKGVSNKGVKTFKCNSVHSVSLEKIKRQHPSVVGNYSQRSIQFNSKQNLFLFSIRMSVNQTTFQNSIFYNKLWNALYSIRAKSLQFESKARTMVREYGSAIPNVFQTILSLTLFQKIQKQSEHFN